MTKQLFKEKKLTHTFAEEQLLLNAKKQYRAQIQALIELPTLIPMTEEQREAVTLERDRIQRKRPVSSLGSITKGQMEQIQAMIDLGNPTQCG